MHRHNLYQKNIESNKDNVTHYLLHRYDETIRKVMSKICQEYVENTMDIAPAEAGLENSRLETSALTKKKCSCNTSIVNPHSHKKFPTTYS